jgi:quinol monooxygenase YgiN
MTGAMPAAMTGAMAAAMKGAMPAAMTGAMAAAMTGAMAAAMTGAMPAAMMGAMAYGDLATMRARPGHRDDVVALLLGGLDGLRAAGCRLYVVGVSESEADTVWVSEVWDSRADHDASLRQPATQAAIGRAMPLLTGEFTGRELTVAGGLGV